MPIRAGQSLSHYHLIEKIGEGGMGVVWKAEDTVLSRTVALKFLSEKFARDPQLLTRFQREARLLATLSHSNIASIHGLEEAESERFLVLEYVPGTSLAERLKEGALPVEDALKVACEIARALEAAHEKGVIHRDLKPGNVQLTPEGRASVLDFGLAKALAPPSSAPEAPQQATVTMATDRHTVIGTTPYMSPEQSTAKPLDKRTDIWSFGCILYELLTAQRAFPGETVSSTIAAIHGQDPEWDRLPSETPWRLRELLRRCLAKDVDRRLHDVADARIEIEDLIAERAWATPSVAPESLARSQRRRWRTVALLSVGILMGAAAASVLWIRVSSPSNGSTDIPSFTNPVRVTSTMRQEAYPSWSPDGRTLAFHAGQSLYNAGSRDIWITQVGVGEPVNRTPDHDGDDCFPTWSPDGRQIAFWSSRDGGGVYVMPVLAGAPRKVFPTPVPLAGAPQWSADGTRVAYIVNAERESSLEIHSLSTSEVQRFPLSNIHRGLELSWSPGGRLVAYTGGDSYLSATKRLHVLRLRDGESFGLTEWSATNPSWSPDGRRLYFVAAGALWRLRLTRDGTPEGIPEQVTAGLQIGSAAWSPDGRKLAYSTGRRVFNLWRVPILEDRAAGWSDAEQLTFDHSEIMTMNLSSDRRFLFATSDRSGNYDLWRIPVRGGEMDQITTHPASDWAPDPSPRGDELLFYSLRSGNRDIWLMPVGGGPARQITHDPQDEAFPAWSPDGRQIAFEKWAGTSNREIWVSRIDGSAARRIIDGGGRPKWSPNGEWLLFGSADGLWRVTASGGEPMRLTTPPARYPRWSPDGNAVYFIRERDDSSDLWLVTIDGEERPVTDLRGRPGGFGDGLATDGQYLYFIWGNNVADIWVMGMANAGEQTPQSDGRGPSPPL